GTWYGSKYCFFLFFFFSSRRRHTRSYGDWSSDVCSSDLHGYNSKQANHERHELREAREHCWSTYHRWWDEDERRWRSDRDWRERSEERRVGKEWRSGW